MNFITEDSSFSRMKEKDIKVFLRMQTSAKELPYKLQDPAVHLCRHYC